MTTGYLMFINSKESLQNKVVRAVDYHIRKTGIVPDLCLIHIGDFEEKECLVTTRPYRGIPKFHIWVGMDD